MNLKDTIRVIEDFPVAGISFKDITTLLKDKDALKAAIDGMCALAPEKVDIVVGPEARGFIFGTAVAYQLGAGFVPVRKPGKLPAPVERFEYELEYGTDALEIHQDAIQSGDKVLLVDDLLATGGTLRSTAKLVEKLGGEVVGIITLIELTDCNGRANTKEYPTHSLIAYEH